MKEPTFSKGQRVEVKGGYGTEFTVYDPCKDLLVEVMGDDGRVYRYNQSDLKLVPELRREGIVLTGKIINCNITYDPIWGKTSIELCYK